jgi:hypothetical protein
LFEKDVTVLPSLTTALVNCEREHIKLGTFQGMNESYVMTVYMVLNSCPVFFVIYPVSCPSHGNPSIYHFG